MNDSLTHTHSLTHTFRFNGPNDVSVSPDGGTVFVADLNNHLVRRIHVSSGLVSTVVGTPQSAGNEEGGLQSVEACCYNM